MRESRWSWGETAILALVAVLAMPGTAFGQYLDPGAGSMIVQVVIALAVGAMATLKLYWRRLTAMLGRRGRDDVGN